MNKTARRSRHNLETLCKLVVLCLGISLLSCLNGIRTDFATLGLFSDLENGKQYTRAQVEAFDQDTNRAFWITLGVIVLCVPFFLTWFRRAYENIDRAGLVGYKHSPGWAVGCWFVPFLNLVRPPQIMAEISKASPVMDESDGGDRWLGMSASPLVSIWWGTWLLGGVISRLAGRRIEGAESIEEFRSVVQMSVTAKVLFIVAGICLIVLVKQISAQQARYPADADDGTRASHGDEVPEDPFADGAMPGYESDPD